MLSYLLQSDPNQHRWLIVTGAPRSGTSYFGEILAMDKRVNSIIEPFNPGAGMPAMTQRYMYGSDPAALSTRERAILEALFAYNFRLKTVYSKRDSFAETAFKTLFFGGNQLALWKARLNRRAAFSLIKDPIAVFLVEALYRMREMDIFYLVRHPLSFVGSLKRLGWNFKIDPLISQPELCSKFLPELVDRDPQSLSWTEHAAYIWLAIGRQMEHLIETGVPVVPIFHEEISADPVSHYKRIYAHLGLDWSNSVRHRIIKTSTASGKAGANSGMVHDYFREASAIFRHSKSQLEKVELEKVVEVTKPVLDRWYLSPTGPKLSDTGLILHMRGL